MHTIFINTSKQMININSEIFDIPRITRQFIYLDCPIDKWMNDNEGYVKCVQNIGEIIDNYKDVNNNFNVVIYVDLIAFKQYSCLYDEGASADIKRSCVDAMHFMVRHYMERTIISRFREVGREPTEILIIFEENPMPGDKKITEKYHNNLWEFMAMPSTEEIVTFFTGRNKDDDDNVKAEFIEMVSSKDRKPLVPKAYETVKEFFDIFIQEMYGTLTTSHDEKEIRKKFFDQVERKYKNNKGILPIYDILVTNRRAEASTNELRAKRDLCVIFYVLKCIYNKNILGGKAESEVDRNEPLGNFREIDWEKVVAHLNHKANDFTNARNYLRDLNTAFTELSLAPPLLEVDTDMFGIDEYGNKIVKTEIVKTESADKDEDKVGFVEVGDKSKKILMEYKLYEEEWELLWEDEPKGPEDMERKALEVRDKHRKDLYSLQNHVKSTLSNYASKSIDNRPALLKKRRVSVFDDESSANDVEVNYTHKKEKDTRPFDSVESIADNGYEYMHEQYFSSCGVQGVKITDISKACNWLINRVNQIKASLIRIKKIALVLLGAIAVLFLPYLILQWEEITKGPIRFLVSFLNIIVPLILFVLAVIAVIIWQKKQYKVAWRKFKKKSDDIIEENKRAATEYDKLLALFIPRLRWFHEYTIDVKFYKDCCRVASAKLAHHSGKVREYISFLDNFLEDLEHDYDLKTGSGSKGQEKNIDLSKAFCNGDKNTKFYSFFTKEDIEKFYKD